MRVLVTGGAGFTGSVLVPRLLEEGAAVTVVDKLVYGNHLPEHPSLRVVLGDVRDGALLARVIPGHDAVVHLAFVSNDPEYELDPRVGDAVNWRAFAPLVDLSRRSGVTRFVFPSSCSVYGSAKGDDVDEEHPPAPLTAYAQMKMACEGVLAERASKDFCCAIVRPATVCGVSPRQRLDLTINRMVAEGHARRGVIVRNPGRIRPSIHIRDLAELYVTMLRAPEGAVNGRVFNAAYENRTVLESAAIVRDRLGADVHIASKEDGDQRSYRVSSERLRTEIGFAPRATVADAVRELAGALDANLLPDPLGAPDYYNMRMEKRVDWGVGPRDS